MFLEVLARRNQAELNLRRTRISAPAGGIVGKVSLQVGEYVKKGNAVIPIVQAGETWIEANLKETQLTYLRTGQTAQVIIDAYQIMNGKPKYRQSAHLQAQNCLSCPPECKWKLGKSSPKGASPS